MPFIDRGPRFAAYYKVSVDSPFGYLYGIHWENSQDCGTFVLDDTTYKLRCIHFYKGEFADAKAKHAEAFDISSWEVDGLATDPVVGALMMGVEPDLSTLHPVAAALIQGDLDAGVPYEDIMESRAALFGDFMGFTLAHVKMVLPPEAYQVDTGETQEVVDEDGNVSVEPVYMETITRCSFENVN
jgi:hypothetical protein